MHTPSATPARQRGGSLLGLLFWVAILVVGAGLAMKLVPVYIEFYSVKQILSSMRSDPDFASMDNPAIRQDFARRASVDYVTAVKPDHLRIERAGGEPVVTVEYAYRTRLVGHASLVIDFFASTDPNAQPARTE